MLRNHLEAYVCNLYKVINKLFYPHGALECRKYSDHVVTNYYEDSKTVVQLKISIMVDELLDSLTNP